MVDRARWTTPRDITARLERLWAGGSLLTHHLAGDAAALFPWEYKLRGPDARALGAEFDAVRQWIRALEDGSKAVRGSGYEIVWSEINHRQTGKNRLPSAVVIADFDDALALLGLQAEARRFQQLTANTLVAFPELAAWLARRPFVALEYDAQWPRILSVLGWFRQHARPGVYLRQLEIPGVDSKFIESAKGLLAELLDLVLPVEHIDLSAHPTRQFEQRYGLLHRQPLVRFRLLDPASRLGGLSDVATPAAQFAQLDLAVRHVFITENETNGVAFPDCPDSIVIFGLGYGLGRLAQVAWLQSKAIHYWGDLDTHGFAILDRLRASLPHARSFLMDRETLELHQALWSHEPSQHVGTLSRLTQDEAALYETLKQNQLGSGVRLEQERIAFAWVRQALNALWR
jgi:hypothetical protein